MRLAPRQFSIKTMCHSGGKVCKEPLNHSLASNVFNNDDPLHEIRQGAKSDS